MTVPATLLALGALALVGCAARAPQPAAPSGPPPAEGTDRHFRHTLLTAAAPESVWALWTDVGTWPDWDTELDSAALDGPWAEGARGRLVPRSGPAARFTVTEVSPRATAFSTRLPLAALRVRRSWAPAGDGRIAITHEVRFAGLLGGAIASRLGPGFRRALPAVMARLDSLARAHTASASGEAAAPEAP